VSSTVRAAPRKGKVMDTEKKELYEATVKCCQAYRSALADLVAAAEKILSVAYGIKKGHSFPSINKAGEEIQIGNIPSAKDTDALAAAVKRARKALR